MTPEEVLQLPEIYLVTVTRNGPTPVRRPLRIYELCHPNSQTSGQESVNTETAWFSLACGLLTTARRGPILSGMSHYLLARGGRMGLVTARYGCQMAQP